MEVIIWAVAFVIFVIAEIATVQLVSIWFAVGAIITLIISALFNLGLAAQLGVFILSSGAFLLITLPLVKKYRKAGFIPTNASLDIGKSAKVIEEISVDKGTGRVTLSGVDWRAVPEKENDIIPEGSIVTVKDVQGAKLVVSLKNETKNN